ncbi:hypothetical protein MXB_2547, partial [Myxobolus squamalis]
VVQKQNKEILKLVAKANKCPPVHVHYQQKKRQRFIDSNKLDRVNPEGACSSDSLSDNDTRNKNARESFLSLVEKADNLHDGSVVNSILSWSSSDDDEMSRTDVTTRPMIQYQKIITRPYFQDQSSSNSPQSSFDNNRGDSVEESQYAMKQKTTIDRSNSVETKPASLPVPTKQIKLLRQNFGQKFIVVRNQRGIKQMFTTVFSRIQNQINTFQIIPKLKICILGFDDCLSLFLQEIVLFNMPKLTDISENTQFLYVPMGKLSTFLFGISPIYSSLFNDEEWSTSCDDNSSDIFILISADISQMVNRISAFIHGNTIPYLLPISTILLKKFVTSRYLFQYHHSSTDDENSTQITIPFIGVNLTIFYILRKSLLDSIIKIQKLWHLNSSNQLAKNDHQQRAFKD